MKLLLEINEKDVNPDLVPTENVSFGFRESSRGVVFADDGSVYLLYVTKYNYHKLPGGGNDAEESNEQAFVREVEEEVGCNSKVDMELGRIIEHRYFANTKQVSYCFVGRQIGPLSEQKLEQDEIEEGHELVQAKSIDDAISKLESDTPTNVEGKMIQIRDLRILREAKKQIS